MRSFRSVLPALLALLLSAACLASPESANNDSGGDGTGKSAEAGNGEAGAHFDIWEFDVEGSTLLDTTLVERTVYQFLGPDKTVANIDAARKALETRYRDAGYPTVIVNIPPQEVRQGVVRLQVVEGRVSRVRVSGSRYFSLDQLKGEIPALAPGRVPHLPDVQAQLGKVNSVTPDRRVTPVFRPGRTPGTVEVELKVKDELPLHGDIELNGRNSQDTTRPRLSTTLRYSNLFQKAQSASLMLMTAPENTDDVKVAALTYVAPLERNDDVVAGYGVITRSNVATAGDITVLGDGSILGARYIHPLEPREHFAHNLTFGVDYKDFKEDLQPGSDVGVKTPISYVSLMSSYRATLAQKSARSTFGAEMHFGVRGLGNTAKEFEEKRFRARPNYIYATAFVTRDQHLPWGLSLYGKFDGQVADSPLVSNEQYSAGGAESVRGYFESQALGDDALHASFELRSPELAKYVWHHLNKLNLFIFADGAKLYVKHPLPGQPGSVQLYGAGTGLRMKGPGGFDADLALAWPLKGNGKIDKGELRPHFRLHYGF